MFKGGKRRQVRLDRLILLAHEGPPPTPLTTVIHLDGDQENLNVRNLAWNNRLKTGQRRCLRCQKPFGSKHNRICPVCTITNQTIDERYA